MPAQTETLRSSGSIPASAGIGLRAPHLRIFEAHAASAAWLEVHPENYFAGGAAFVLETIRERYPLSLHGVGLSLGSTDPLDRQHLLRLRAAVERFEPGLVSEHLSWSSVAGRHINDLLPLPFTTEALRHLVERVDAAQAFLGRRLLIENVSSYLEYIDAEMTEHEFLAELVQRTGCGVLLDVNNVFVNACNHGNEPLEFLRGIPSDAVGEIHLAGHSVQTYAGDTILVDTHDHPVCEEVWALYEEAVRLYGRVPTLIERDSRLPAVEILLAEAARADRIMESFRDVAA